MKCTCYIHVSSEPTETRIVFCPLHDAAPDMLAYIKLTMPQACGFSQGAARALAHADCHCAWHDAEALLKRIEPTKGGPR